jgi:hypothetical protein
MVKSMVPGRKQESEWERESGSGETQSTVRVVDGKGLATGGRLPVYAAHMPQKCECSSDAQFGVVWKWQ